MSTRQSELIVAQPKVLTRKQELFARLIVANPSWTQTECAIEAGFKPDNATVTASQLMVKKEVRAAISRLQRQCFERVEITAAETLREIAAIAFANLEDFVTVGPTGEPVIDLTKLQRDQWAAISEVTEDATGGDNDGERRLVLRRRLKMHPKLQALELLAKHFKLLTDKVEHDLSDRMVERLAQGRQRLKTIEASAA